MRALRTTIIVLAITAGIYAAVDYLVGVWHRHHLDMSFLEGSPAYRGQPYATEAFIREKTLEPGQWLKIPDQALLAPTTYHGDFFNVDELPPTGIAYRRTINPPADARPERIVLLVGGSTVYGPEVPDALTIASQLSRYLNARDPGHRYVVYNAGVNAADSTQDRDRLAYELSRGLRPAVVVVADGQLDIVYGIYQGKPGQPAALLESRSGIMGFFHQYLPTNIAQMVWLWFHDRAVAQRRAAQASQAQAAAAKAPVAAKPAAVTVKPAAAVTPPAVAAMAAPPTPRSPAATTTAVPFRPIDRQTAEIYRRNHLAMGDMAAKNGAAFLSVLPPSPFSTQYDHPTADLRATFADTQAQLPGLVAVEREGQTTLAGVMHDLAGQGRHSLDLSDLFKAKTDDVFVDLSHLNGAGNGVLAEKIGEAVLELLPPS
jgi:hypothetical protein